MPALDRDGVSIHYEVSGSDSGRLPVLLSHGFGSSLEMWEPNLAALSADCEVITWDMRGHGRSDSPDDPAAYSEALAVDDMRALLDECGIERAVLGGLSFGGYCSLAFRLVHPERVAALALFDTGPGYKSDEGRDGWNRTMEQTARAYEEGRSPRGPASREVERASRFDPGGLARAARGMVTQHDRRVIDSLPEIAVPTLVVVGADDAPFRAAADYMAAKIPGASLVVLDDAGHAANLDQPEAFNRAVVEFLTSL